MKTLNKTLIALFFGSVFFTGYILYDFHKNYHKENPVCDYVTTFDVNGFSVAKR